MMKDRKYRIIYNCDCTEAFRRYPSPMTAEQLGMVEHSYIKVYELEVRCVSRTQGGLSK
jgi:hypothetical protein